MNNEKSIDWLAMLRFHIEEINLSNDEEEFLRNKYINQLVQSTLQNPELLEDIVRDYYDGCVQDYTIEEIVGELNLPENIIQDLLSKRYSNIELTKLIKQFYDAK